MKCSVVLCVGALVALAASKPTDKLNRNHSSLTVVSSAVVTVSPDYAVVPSGLSRDFLPAHSVSNHKRVRRTVWGDGKKCSTGKIRVGQTCMSCAILQKQNPHACKNHNDTLDSQTATQETL
ncbi:uncharacterized protein [Choristoneura fumiferana]|uniref:uncharacterized protein n=1 Tax=Choristoneura fumiferana TaxID=7141 RepID=UPI003D15596C